MVARRHRERAGHHASAACCPMPLIVAYWTFCRPHRGDLGCAHPAPALDQPPLFASSAGDAVPVGTEREALEAGSVWWDGELFSGRPDWQRLLAMPSSRLSREEQAFLDGPVEELCRMLDDWRITHEDRDLPPEVWRFIRDKGFFGMIIPRRYGGLEFSAYAHSEVVMKLASRSITAAVTVMVPNSLGPGRAAAALRHRRAEEPLPAAPGARRGDPLLRA